MALLAPLSLRQSLFVSLCLKNKKIAVIFVADARRKGVSVWRQAAGFHCRHFLLSTAIPSLKHDNIQ
jgi:hypothetical protein